MSREQVTR